MREQSRQKHSNLPSFRMTAQNTKRGQLHKTVHDSNEMLINNLGHMCIF